MVRVKGRTEYVELLFTEDVSLKEAEKLLLDETGNSFYTNAEICIKYSGITFSYDEEMCFEKIVKAVFGENAQLMKKHKLTKKQIEYSLCEGERISKTVMKSLRNGEVIRFCGDVIVYGDVNPGAYVYAGGNITVIGALRGYAKVKAGGKIYATYMSPTQLRIGNICSYNKKAENVGPAVATEKNGEIILQCL